MNFPQTTAAMAASVVALLGINAAYAQPPPLPDQTRPMHMVAGTLACLSYDDMHRTAMLGEVYIITGNPTFKPHLPTGCVISGHEIPVATIVDKRGSGNLEFWKVTILKPKGTVWVSSQDLRSTGALQ